MQSLPASSSPLLSSNQVSLTRHGRQSTLPPRSASSQFALGTRPSFQFKRVTFARHPNQSDVLKGKRSCSVWASGERSSTEPATTPTIELGESGLMVSEVGIGAWSWGDKSYWGFENGYGEEDVKRAFRSCMESGLVFLDTAEVYGLGKSEELVGEFIREYKGEGGQAIVATKFAPLPWRFTKDSVVSACRASLKRLGMEQMDLYMQHWPGFPVLNSWANEAFLEGLAECYKLGLCKAVGVSNFNEKRLREAHAFLKERGVPLASNQVQYSLIYRAPERNGVADACKELGITLVAYSPFAQGLLTGKYNASSSVRPSGPRKGIFTDERLREVEPLVELMRSIGENHDNKTPSQVALNWLVCKGALPIPGVKNEKQVIETAGSCDNGWRLTDDEMAQLDTASAKISNAFGAPFENW